MNAKILRRSYSVVKFANLHPRQHVAKRDAPNVFVVHYVESARGSFTSSNAGNLTGTVLNVW